RKSSTRVVVRLYTATVKPRPAMFSARFSPITASPIRPMSAAAAGEAEWSVCVIIYILNVIQPEPFYIRQITATGHRRQAGDQPARIRCDTLNAGRCMARRDE